jgi:hypothetical protein
MYEIWMVDKNRCVWHEDGFDWWPSPFRLRVRVSDAVEVDGLTNYKVTVTSDFWKDVDLSNPKHRLYITGLQLQTSTYAPRVFDDRVTARTGLELDSRLELVSCVYIREDNFSWLPRLFAQLAIMLPIDSSIRASRIGDDAGLESDMSVMPHGLSELDEILEVADQVYAPAGKHESRWIGSEEFEEAITQLNEFGYFYANGDGTGLTAESAFLDDTALIRIRTEEVHPQLGHGLLVTLHLPIWVDDFLSTEPSAFNALESSRFTCVPLLGSWATHQISDDQNCMAYSMFIPNALYMPGLVMNLALWMHGRAEWVKSEFFADSEDTPLNEVLEKRYRAISESSPD